MLPTGIGFLGDMCHCSVLILEVLGFPKGCCHHDLKVFCETRYNSVLSNVAENMN